MLPIRKEGRKEGGREGGRVARVLSLVPVLSSARPCFGGVCRALGCAEGALLGPGLLQPFGVETEAQSWL